MNVPTKLFSETLWFLLYPKSTPVWTFSFGVAHGWRCARLVDGELLDVDLPPSRPQRHDDETEGFAARESPDDTEVIRVVRA